MTWTTPFHYDFMLAAMGVGALVGAVCAVFLTYASREAHHQIQ